MSTSVDVVTFGCRLNTYESEVMRTHALSENIENTTIINTCAVTSEAERQARQLIRKIARETPDRKIVVTGCAAQIRKDAFSSLPGVVAVLGNQEKTTQEAFKRISELNLAQSDPYIAVGDIFESTSPHTPVVSTYPGIARGFVEIQNGCNHRCTFCTIPFGRGNSRSVPLGHLVEQVKHLISKGYQEIVLTGVDITAYGEDLPGKPTLGMAVKRLLHLAPELPRLRLSSLDPVEIDEDLFDLFAHDPRLMPHVHLSVQAGDTLILKRMKRRHVREDVLKTCERLKSLRPDVIFGADIIAGFPTESAEMFENTLRLIEEAKLTYLHVFPYSPRPGTPAARMPQVVKSDIKMRAKQLREAGAIQHIAHLESLIGKTLEVLVESPARGRTECYASVDIPCDSAPVGTIVRVMLERRSGLCLEGKVMSTPLYPHLPELSDYSKAT